MLTQSPPACRAPSRARGRSPRSRPRRADDAPRASMTAAPRCCTVGMNVSSIHAWSTSSFAGLPSTLAWYDVGVLRGGVVAPDRHVRDRRDRHAGLRRELRHGPVVVEARHRGEPLARDRCRALFIAIRQFVLAGLPTTSTRTSSAALAASALPCDGEDRAVGLEQILALHALRARARADEQRVVDALERLRRRRRSSRRRRAAGTRSRRAP